MIKLFGGRQEPTSNRRRRPSLSQSGVTLLLAGAVVVLSGGTFAGLGTGAVFNDVGTSTGNAFTTGMVDLKLNGADNISATLTLNDIEPGDSITRPIAVVNTNGVIANQGKAVPARYSVTSLLASGSEDLAKRLDLEIGRQGASGGTCDTTATFGNPGSATGNAWTLIYQGDLARSTAALNLVGNPIAGQDGAVTGQQISGDRLIAGNGGAEYLCFRVTFKDAQDASSGVPGEGGSSAHSYVQNDSDGPSTDNDYANKATEVTFTFRAEQTSQGTAS
jgi:hypothetical protein